MNQERELTIAFDETGARAVYDDDLAPTLSALGDVTVTRASHILPKRVILRMAFRLMRFLLGETGSIASWTRRWRCEWYVDMRPIGGGIIPGSFNDRQEAIEAEVEVLRKILETRS